MREWMNRALARVSRAASVSVCFLLFFFGRPLLLRFVASVEDVFTG